MLTREALEGMAARLAAERMSNEEMQSMRRLLDSHAHQPELASGEAYVQRSLDEDFHFSIIRGAQCERLERLLMNEIYYQLRTHRRRSSTQPGRAQAALSEHLQIVAALESRDPDRAEMAMRTHLRNARFSSLASLKADGTGNGAFLPKLLQRLRPPARPPGGRLRSALSRRSLRFELGRSPELVDFLHGPLRVDHPPVGTEQEFVLPVGVGEVHRRRAPMFRRIGVAAM